MGMKMRLTLDSMAAMAQTIHGRAMGWHWPSYIVRHIALVAAGAQVTAV